MLEPVGILEEGAEDDDVEEKRYYCHDQEAEDVIALPHRVSLRSNRV